MRTSLRKYNRRVFSTEVTKQATEINPLHDLYNMIMNPYTLFSINTAFYVINEYPRGLGPNNFGKNGFRMFTYVCAASFWPVFWIWEAQQKYNEYKEKNRF